MVERRQFPRYLASWPIRLWPTEGFFVFGRAADVSRKGMRIVLSVLAPAAEITPGRTYRVQVNPWQWPHTELECHAVIRHLSGGQIGVQIEEELPVHQLPGNAPSTGF
jgi:PilZ domain-containing protein